MDKEVQDQLKCEDESWCIVPPDVEQVVRNVAMEAPNIEERARGVFPSEAQRLATRISAALRPEMAEQLPGIHGFHNKPSNEAVTENRLKELRRILGR